MRLLRAWSALLLMVVSLAFVLNEGPTARAQSVDEAENAARAAEIRADATRGIVGNASAARAGIEDELAASIVRLNEINSELTRVSVELEQIRAQLVSAEGEMASISAALEVEAIDAYMRAVALPAASVVGTGDAETAIVAASSIDRIITSDQAQVDRLTIQRGRLQDLTERYLADQTRVEELQAEADAESATLEGLLAEADADLASAASDARAADAAYRAALGEVDAARAREAERQRDQDRQSTTTSTAPSPGSSTTSATTTTTTIASGDGPPAPTTTTTTTTTPAPLVGGVFPPAVERWRPTVAAYFPGEHVDAALTIIKCESNGDPDAYNPYSGASGLFQFLPSTWAAASHSAGFGGADVFDAEANIGSAAWLSAYYEGRGLDPWTPWTCRP